MTHTDNYRLVAGVGTQTAVVVGVAAVEIDTGMRSAEVVRRGMQKDSYID